MLQDKTLAQFSSELASSAPAPGGGALAAIEAALACSQAHMLCALKLEQKSMQTAENEPLKKDLQCCAYELEELEQLFWQLAQEDEHAYQKVAGALKLPRSTEEEKTARTKTLTEALIAAAHVPLQVLENVCKGFDLAELASHIGAQSALSDAAVTAASFQSAGIGAYATVLANTHYLKDVQAKEAIAKQAQDFLARIQQYAQIIINASLNKLR